MCAKFLNCFFFSLQVVCHRTNGIYHFHIKVIRLGKLKSCYRKSNKIITLSQLVWQLRRHITKICVFAHFQMDFIPCSSIFDSVSLDKFVEITHFVWMSKDWRTLLPTLFFRVRRIFLAVKKSWTNFLIWETFPFCRFFEFSQSSVMHFRLKSSSSTTPMIATTLILIHSQRQSSINVKVKKEQREGKYWKCSVLFFSFLHQLTTTFPCTVNQLIGYRSLVMAVN